MMYMFDHEEITCCADCELSYVTRVCPIKMVCHLDLYDVECTDEGEGLPIGCPLRVVTMEAIKAHGIE